MAKMKRVTVDDLLRWSPVADAFDADDLRQHPTYDTKTDTVEVYKSHADQIELRKALQALAAAATPALRDMTAAMVKFSEAATAATRQVAAALSRVR